MEAFCAVIGMASIFFIIYLIFDEKCPSCNGYRKETIEVNTIEKSSWFTLGKMITTYRCKACGHVWDVEGIDDKYGYW